MQRNGVEGGRGLQGLNRVGFLYFFFHECLPGRTLTGDTAVRHERSDFLACPMPWGPGLAKSRSLIQEGDSEGLTSGFSLPGARSLNPDGEGGFDSQEGLEPAKATQNSSVMLPLPPSCSLFSL